MICKNCNVEKDKSQFSNTQLKKKYRKCKSCLQDSDNFTMEKQKVLFSNLMNWLRNNGAEFPFLEIKHYNERFRGIVATKNIYKNKNILKVPHCCIMTTLKAYKSHVGLEIKKSGWEPPSSHTWLALMLLEEKLNPTSFWKPFIDILPPNYNDFPQFYSSDELNQLKGSFIVDMIKSRNLNLEKEFNQIVSIIPEFCKKIKLQDYVWARIAIVSRIFNIAYEKDNSTQGIVPMADMLNHSKEPGTRWMFYPDEDAFIITSEKFMFKDKEIFDTYGLKCNSRYLVNYGFTLSDNQENNQAVVFINPANRLQLFQNNETSIDDSYCEYRFLINEGKETLISQDKNFRFQFVILSDKKVEPPKSMTGLHSIWCLFGMLRLLLSSDVEFENFMKNLTKTDFVTMLLSVSPFSVQTELLVLKELSNTCEKVLDNFPSTIEMDQAELETATPYSNRWNILNMLIGEKTVLLYYRDLGVYVTTLFSDGNDVYKIGKHLRKNSRFSSYYKVYWEQLMK